MGDDPETAPDPGTARLYGPVVRPATRPALRAGTRSRPGHRITDPVRSPGSPGRGHAPKAGPAASWTAGQEARVCGPWWISMSPESPKVSRQVSAR
ncbi:hypothetical protein GCM10010216_36330 [Streptomyces flaveolus]|nr:hypothetical protein GCM10010216_36330 [Streptomyces flaveolus]